MDFLTHYYRKGTEPFRSLLALADDEAARLMQTMYIEGSVIWERFKDPCQYLRDRKRTEEWLREAFLAKGGRPQAAFPVYTVLGNSKWVERMADPLTLATTAEIRIPLSIFEESDVNFTYPDSMISYWLGNDQSSEYYQPGYHGKVFTRSEILAIVKSKGLPEEGWETKTPDALAHYVEAQVWNHEILLKYYKQQCELGF